MKGYMLDLLNKIGVDKGKTINYLIDTEVLTKNYIIKQAIATKDRPRTLYDAYTLYNIALYVKNLTNDDKEKIFFNRQSQTSAILFQYQSLAIFLLPTVPKYDFYYQISYYKSNNLP